jgi:hypothetical protein
MAVDAATPQSNPGARFHGLSRQLRAQRGKRADEFIVQVPSQLIGDVPANIPRALLPEFIGELILRRSLQMGRIRRLRIL